MSVLIDVTRVPEACCTDHLELMAKATAEGPGTPEGMFRPLENPWARAIVERSTARLQKILADIEAALARFLEGSNTELRKADVPWQRWDEGEFEAVRARLEGLKPDAMTIEDYQLLVRYLIERYLPDGVIESEADFLVVQSQIMGKIQRNLGGDRRMNQPRIDALALLLPTRFAEVPEHVLTPREEAVMIYGKAHCAENIQAVTDAARHRMMTICLEHIQGGLIGAKEGTWAHAKIRLFDEFSVLNRDFRRIAVTEGGEAVNQGFVLATPIGQQVKRIEAYKGACAFCESINGRTFTVVSPTKNDKNGETEIWSGKTNVGRSASPMRREGNTLVERTKDELWWPAAGTQHPHCRGSWFPITAKPPEVSQQFYDFLQSKLDAAKRAAVG